MHLFLYMCAFGGIIPERLAPHHSPIHDSRHARARSRSRSYGSSRLNLVFSRIDIMDRTNDLRIKKAEGVSGTVKNVCTARRIYDRSLMARPQEWRSASSFRRDPDTLDLRDS